MDKGARQVLLHVGLFLLTFATTTLAGAEWIHSKYLLWMDEARLTWPDFVDGLRFSVPFLLILSCHEFGHYFTARHYRISVSLPYYIPMWLGFVLMPSFGTMGAVIRIKQRIHRRSQYFDIGVAGPLAGFVVAVGVIWYGFASLPGLDYLFAIHPEYEEYGAEYATYAYNSGEYLIFTFGDNLLFKFFKLWVADPALIPHENEIIHYPLLMSGYLALLFTSLNLLPMGQLDGGHILYGMVGAKWHARISRMVFTAFLFYAGLGVLSVEDMPDGSLQGVGQFLFVGGAYLYFLYICTYSMFEEKKERWTYAAVVFGSQFVVHTATGWQGYEGWLLFGLVIGRFLGVDHPAAQDSRRPLSLGRHLLGWLALIVFIVSFSPEPLRMTVIGE